MGGGSLRGGRNKKDGGRTSQRKTTPKAARAIAAANPNIGCSPSNKRQKTVCLAVHHNTTRERSAMSSMVEGASSWLLGTPFATAQDTDQLRSSFSSIFFVCSSSCRSPSSLWIYSSDVRLRIRNGEASKTKENNNKRAEKLPQLPMLNKLCVCARAVCALCQRGVWRGWRLVREREKAAAEGKRVWVCA